MMNITSKVINVKQALRLINLAKYSTSVKGDSWNGPVSYAEKVVGYPTSFLSLRWLLNDEISNIAVHITRLIGTNHPVIEIARNLLHQNNCPKWGLIVLLISKAAGIQTRVADIDRDVTSGILHNQRALAEIIEMIKTGHTLHKGMMKIKDDDENFKDLNFGNKIALLSGDYLYSKSFQELAQLQNHDLNEIISTSLRDLAEAEFFEPRDCHNNPLPCPPSSMRKSKISKTDPGPYNFLEYAGNAKEEWILRNLLGGANLLAKTCKGTLILGGHPEFLQNQAYIFGRSIALAWQANEETKPFLKEEKLPFNLVSAPVLFHLQSEPELYKLLKVSDVNYNNIKKKVLEGDGIQKTMDMQMEFVDEALNALDYFPSSDAKESLVKISRSLEC